MLVWLAISELGIPEPTYIFEQSIAQPSINIFILKNACKEDFYHSSIAFIQLKNTYLGLIWQDATT